MKRSMLVAFLLTSSNLLIGQLCNSDFLDQRTVRASQTDGNIAFELFQHQIFINTECEQNDKLLVHLVGSFGNPSSTTFFPAIAANNGYKVINLKYSNDVAAFSTCSASSDATCYRDFRSEVPFGTSSSSAVDVDFTNSIVNRLQKLLVYLEDNFTAEGWGAFLNSTQEEVVWSNLVLSGHSQGGGLAAFIAKQMEVDRVLMFASPNDYSTFFSAPAEWVSNLGLTPAENHFAFGNINDEVVAFSQQFEIWEDMNLLVQADSIQIDKASCNYNEAHVLYTTSMFESPHSNMIRDASTPMDGGEPVFTPVWEYMLGICETSSITHPIENYEDNIQLFPHPASSFVEIQAEENIENIEVYSSSGEILQSVRVDNKSYELEIESYLGLLLLKITLSQAQHTIVKRLIVN